MKLRMITEDKMPQPTEEMIKFFEKRTKEHIDRVGKYLKILYNKTDLGDELLDRVETHDETKYGPDEHLPYIWLTEFHRCKNDGESFEYPPGVEEQVKEATYHHITNNRHHPEYHDNPRDMTDIDIAEMVADWAAMAEELGNSARGWAEKNVGSKWKFDGNQTDLIFELISKLEE